MIVVIGILFAVLISRVDFASDDAKATGAMTDLRSFQTAAHAIAWKHNGFDSDLETLTNQLNTKLDSELQLSVSGGKIVSAATDPWGTPYEVTVAGNTLMVASAGKNTSFKSTDDLLTIIKCVTSSDGFDVVVSNHTDLTGINFASLENASWADISEVSASGFAAYVYSIGDTKVVNSSWTVQIADFDHDDLADGSGKAGISFVTKDSTYQRAMNSANNNYGGWKASEMRPYLNGTTSGSFYYSLSTDLKSVIKSVNKVSDLGYDESTGTWAGKLTTTSDKIWLPSIYEYNIQHMYYYPEDTVQGQGTAYALFLTGGDPHVNGSTHHSSCDYSGYGDWFWFRTAHRSSRGFCTDYACGCQSYCANSNASNVTVAPGFCI